jgi:hypothetical protein
LTARADCGTYWLFRNHSSGNEGKHVTIVRVGTNQKYSDGWETAFSGKKAKPAAKKAGGKKAAKKPSPKKPAKKSKKK